MTSIGRKLLPRVDQLCHGDGLVKNGTSLSPAKSSGVHELTDYLFGSQSDWQFLSQLEMVAHACARNPEMKCYHHPLSSSIIPKS